MKFKGYVRSDGRVGIRNHLLVLPTTIASTETAKYIAKGAEEAVSLSNQVGRTLAQEDFDQVWRTLKGFGTHPNVAAVLVVGLGGEDINAAQLAEEIRQTGKRAEVLIIKEEGGVAKTIKKGIEVLKELKQEADRMQTEEVGVENLMIGIECGGSDTTSGLAANPAAGVASDLLVEQGGTTFLSETPELIGAEHILARNAASPEVGKQILETVYRYEENLKRSGVDFRGAQPSPGNIRGGLTTIEEKSLGAIYKSGLAPIQGVLKYAEAPVSPGHYLMDSPGYDIESVTGMIAGGAQIIIFTTGRGTPVGSPICPVIKVCGNPQTVKRMIDNIDVDASKIIEGEKTIDEVGKSIFDLIVEVANGRFTKSEQHGFTEFAINRVI
ncbi:altronate dehydratase large subunit [Caldalkalibacillus uzonensis]|uniref:Altronate dehydratase large subunit n=1 Tax=Caldalkalibacillus uzonensis TaxID=353224 RepID=A0ABU0CQY5_9BACI|nr:UxaA family hydrolase [Caldalkalibacillus uzonensis]MDQ0338299.1 altronate dehydratase large subunit [Caldalkalibacillus uzonensis]